MYLLPGKWRSISRWSLEDFRESRRPQKKPPSQASPPPSWRSANPLPSSPVRHDLERCNAFTESCRGGAQNPHLIFAVADSTSLFEFSKTFIDVFANNPLAESARYLAWPINCLSIPGSRLAAVPFSVFVLSFNREILAFFYLARSYIRKILWPLPVIESDKITFYRHLLCKFDFTEQRRRLRVGYSHIRQECLWLSLV